MEKYRVIEIQGRKRNVVWESDAFDSKNGETDFATWKVAVREAERYKMELWSRGYFVDLNGNSYYMEGNKVGRIEIQKA